MNGLILSAGLGTRLGKLTENTPKPMIKIAGKPVLEHLVDYLNSWNVEKIIVNTHHKPLKIMEYFGTRLVYSYEPKLLGEEGTILSLKNWLMDDYTVVMNGDTLTNLNLAEMLKTSGGRNVRSMDGDIYTGTMIISPSYFEGNNKFSYYSHKDTWFVDMGTPEGLKKAKEIYE